MSTSRSLRYGAGHHHEKKRSQGPTISLSSTHSSRLRTFIAHRKTSMIYAVVALALIYLLGYNSEVNQLLNSVARHQNRTPWVNETWLQKDNDTRSLSGSKHAKHETNLHVLAEHRPNTSDVVSAVVSSASSTKSNINYANSPHLGFSSLLRGALQAPLSIGRHSGGPSLVNLQHLSNWMRHMYTHVGYGSFDRLSFAQMSFQTRMYARLLRHIDEVPASLLDQFEEDLWFFIPGLPQLRAAHGHVRTDSVGIKSTGSVAGANALPQDVATSQFRRVMDRFRPARPSASSVAQVSQKPDSQGIVIVAGDEHLPFAVQLIATIRNAHHCDMPIEVYFSDHKDLGDEGRTYLETMFSGVRTISLNASSVYDADFAGFGNATYALRSFAALASNFTQVMLLDADTILTVDPHDFFSEKGYTRTGTLFFPYALADDLKDKDTRDFLRDQVGRRGPSRQLGKSEFWRKGLMHYQDSGVVLLNKAKVDVFAALLFIVWQNSAWIRNHLTYEMFYGDKESYWLAFELPGFPYHFSPYSTGALGAEYAAHDERFCAEHSLHLLDSRTSHTHRRASVAASPDDSSSNRVSVKELPLQHGRRVAWWNGSLLKSRKRGPRQGSMTPETLVWALDGRWSGNDDGDVCLRKYTPRTVKELHIEPAFHVLLHTGRSALERLTNRVGL